MTYENYLYTAYQLFSPVFKHIGILLGVSFVAGIVVRMYGNTCGIDITSPTSWPFSLILIGSPWCNHLAKLALWMTTAIENMWVVLCTLLMVNIASYIPSETVKKAFLRYSNEVKFDINT